MLNGNVHILRQDLDDILSIIFLFSSLSAPRLLTYYVTYYVNDPSVDTMTVSSINISLNFTIISS